VGGRQAGFPGQVSRSVLFIAQSAHFFPPLHTDSLSHSWPHSAQWLEARFPGFKPSLLDDGFACQFLGGGNCAADLDPRCVQLCDFFGDQRTLLAVSSLADEDGRKWQAGSVQIFDLTGIKGNLEFEELIVVTTLLGEEQASHFSWNMATSSNSLWVSEPFYGNVRADEKASTGRVFEWKFGKDFPTGRVNNLLSTPTSCIVGQENRSSFGHKILTLDLNADGKEDLVISATHSDTGALNSGHVSIFFG